MVLSSGVLLARAIAGGLGDRAMPVGLVMPWKRMGVLANVREVLSLLGSRWVDKCDVDLWSRGAAGRAGHGRLGGLGGRSQGRALRVHCRRSRVAQSRANSDIMTRFGRLDGRLVWGNAERLHAVGHLGGKLAGTGGLHLDSILSRDCCENGE